MYNMEWFNTLKRPVYSPPAEIFTPAWIFLYITIFAALVIFISAKSYGKKAGYTYFAIQMVLNLLWSPVFFGMRNMGLALVVIIFLDIFVVMTIREFYKVSKLSGLILIPYLLWLLFATYLNIGYFVLN